MDKTYASQTLTELVSGYKKFAKELEPYRDRFYAFITENDLTIIDPYGFYVGHGVYQSYFPDVSNFELSLNSDDSIYFHYDESSYDGMESYFFTIPFEYLSNPDGWEARILATLDGYQRIVDEAYESIAPGMREKYSLNVILQSVQNGEINAWVTYGDETGIRLNDPNPEIVTNLFSVNIVTRKVTRQGVIVQSSATQNL